jgi:hypothetical protein
MALAMTRQQSEVSGTPGEATVANAAAAGGEAPGTI